MEMTETKKHAWPVAAVLMAVNFVWYVGAFVWPVLRVLLALTVVAHLFFLFVAWDRPESHAALRLAGSFAMLVIAEICFTVYSPSSLRNK